MGSEVDYSIEEIDEGKWRENANCKSRSVDLFFTDGSGDSSRYLSAKTLCFNCPVQKQCLDYAVLNSIVYGLWGGMPYRERLQYRVGKRSHKLELKDVLRGYSNANDKTLTKLSETLGISKDNIKYALGIDKKSMARRVRRQRDQLRLKAGNSDDQ